MNHKSKFTKTAPNRACVRCAKSQRTSIARDKTRLEWFKKNIFSIFGKQFKKLEFLYAQNDIALGTWCRRIYDGC